MLKSTDVHDALAYADDHLAEIEADLAADEEVAVNMQGSGNSASLGKAIV